MQVVDATCMTCETPIRWDPIAPRLCMDCYCKLRERVTSVLTKAEAIAETEIVTKEVQEQRA